MRLDLQTWGYCKEYNKPVIWLKGRDISGNKHWVKAVKFPPHFFAVSSPQEATETDILGRPIKYIEVNMPRDVGLDRVRYAETCEAKLPYVIHYLIHKKIKCGIEVDKDVIRPAQDLGVKPYAMYLDFEMLSPPEIMPEPKNPIYPICQMSFRDKEKKKNYLYCLRHPNAKEFGFEYFDKETEMYDAALDLINDIAPDALAGWWNNRYDFPYWYRRSRKIRYYPIKRLSPLGTVICKFDEHKGRAISFVAWGLECVDLLEFYKVLTKPEGQKFTYDLKWIVSTECGFAYEDLGDRIDIFFKGEGLTKDGLTGHEALYKYAVNEMKALELIDNKRDIIGEFDRRRRIFGTQLQTSHIAFHNVVTYLHRVADKPLPTFEMKKLPTFRGALPSVVRRRGLFDNTAVFDIHTLYPSIIVELNLSFESKISSTEFRLEPTGVLPKAVASLMAERAKLRKMRQALEPDTPEYKLVYTREQSIKYAIRAFWGCMKHLDIDIAKKITATGRTILQKLISKAQKIGYTVIHYDTDSIFVPLHQFSLEEASQLESYLNHGLADISKELRFKKTLTLETEKIFDILFLHRSKHYVGNVVYADGKSCNFQLMRGIAARRSDSARITVNLQKKFFNLLLREKDRVAAVQLLRGAIQNFTDNDTSYIAIPKGVHKFNRTNPWIRGMKNGQELYGFRFREDRKPLLVYSKYVKDRKVRELCFPDYETADETEGVQIDYRKMIEKTIKNKFKEFVEVLGYDWIFVRTGKKQTKMEVWI